MSMNRVLAVVVEHEQGKIKPVSLEVLSASRKLADQISGKVIAFCLSHEANSQAELFIRYGADEVRFLIHPDLQHYIHENYAFALLRQMEKLSFEEIREIIIQKCIEKEACGSQNTPYDEEFGKLMNSKNEADFSLNIPIVAIAGNNAGIARNIDGHWRLIGFGEVIQ